MRKFDAYKKEDPGTNGLNNASILTFSKDVVNEFPSNKNSKDYVNRMELILEKELESRNNAFLIFYGIPTLFLAVNINVSFLN